MKTKKERKKETRKDRPYPFWFPYNPATPLLLPTGLYTLL